MQTLFVLAAHRWELLPVVIDPDNYVEPVHVLVGWVFADFYYSYIYIYVLVYLLE